MAIAFDGVTAGTTAQCAKLFNRQFVEHPPRSDHLNRKIKRAFRLLNTTSDDIAFSADEVAEVIKKCKPSKAMGPDDISSIMLKHIGPLGYTYLSVIFNLSLKTLVIPDIWKTGRVVPLLKSGKPSDRGDSYRPISLLSPVVKTLEALLLPSLRDHLELATHQHGFRSLHSTTTALHEISDQISSGLNQKKPPHRTVAVALDLSKAFDTVSHSILLQDIGYTELPNTIKRWISNYLSGRQSFVEFRNCTSTFRKVKQGVPQGGVLSPLLFNFYLSKLPEPPLGVKVVSYADDCTVLASGPCIGPLCDRLNPYLDNLVGFFESRNLRISVPKSSATIFTSWTKEVNTTLDLHVNGTQLPTVKQPKILGVTFDSMFTFGPHAKNIQGRVQNRTNP